VTEPTYYRPDRLGHRLALCRQHLNLPQLGDDLLRRAPLPCHSHPFHGRTGFSQPADYF
jgi:hypothetical protein